MVRLRLTLALTPNLSPNPNPNPNPNQERCARNCLLYQNPAAYSRALSGLISRTVKLQPPPAVA